MNEELKKLIERFETEIWLYLDGCLDSEEKVFWDEQLSRHNELKSFYNNILHTLSKYDVQDQTSLSEKEFEEMIGAATKQVTFFTPILEKYFSNNLSTTKVVLTGMLTVAALLILLTTEKPNAVKNISNDILSWQGESINREISSVDNSIEVLSVDEWEKYQYFRATHDKWEQAFYLLNNEIERIQKEIEETSL